jgi:hypothetical protein
VKIKKSSLVFLRKEEEDAVPDPSSLENLAADADAVPPSGGSGPAGKSADDAPAGPGPSTVAGGGGGVAAGGSDGLDAEVAVRDGSGDETFEDEEPEFDLTKVIRSGATPRPSLSAFVGVAPEATLDMGEVLGQMIEDELEALGLLRPPGGHADLDSWPYTPHPVAQEHDAEVLYSELDPAAQASFASARSGVETISRVIASELRGALQARTTCRTQRGVRKGKLDRRRLHTVNRPGAQPNRNVFTRRSEGEEIDTDIFLLGDESGSMATSNKIGISQASQIALGDALAGLESFGVGFAVSGFSCGDDMSAYGDGHDNVDRTESLLFHYYKRWSEPWRVAGNRLGHMRARGDNCDGESVRWATNELLGRRAARKILIVLSDGYPAVLTRMDASRVNEDLKRAVKEATQLGVEVIGIGICSEAVKQFYPRYFVVNHPKDLQTTLMKELGHLFGLEKAS